MKSSLIKFYAPLIKSQLSYISFSFRTLKIKNLNLAASPSLYQNNLYYFAKISKKKQEKLDKVKEKSTSTVPEEIDLTEYEDSFKQEVDNYKKEIAKMKTGRLTADLFDGYYVQAYGEKTSITELAQVVAKSATSIVLNVYDEHVIPDIMKFLENSDMNFLIKRNEKSINCSITSGNTKEIKESTLKAAKTLLEAYKGKFRKIRANGMDSLKPFRKFSSEDVMKEAENEVHKIFTKQTAELERVLKEKERELMK